MNAHNPDLTSQADVGSRIRSAGQLDPEKLPRLQEIAQLWAGSAAGRLKAMSAGDVSVEPAGISALVLKAGSEALDNQGFGAMLASATWGEGGLLYADAALVDTVIDALFGSEAGDPDQPSRPMTDLDRSIARLATEAFCRSAADAFGGLIPADLSCGAFAAGDLGEAFFGGRTGAKLRTVAFAFEISSGGRSCVLTLALPESALAPYRRKLARASESTTALADDDWAATMRRGFNQTDMEMRAILDHKRLTLAEISRFRVGDTIALSTGVNGLINLECQGQRLFRARVGKSRDSYVVRVEERIDPRKDFIDDILSD